MLCEIERYVKCKMKEVKYIVDNFTCPKCGKVNNVFINSEIDKPRLCVCDCGYRFITIQRPVNAVYSVVDGEVKEILK